MYFFQQWLTNSPAAKPKLRAPRRCCYAYKANTCFSVAPSNHCGTRRTSDCRCAVSPPPCIPYWRRQTLNEHQCGLLRGRNSLRSVDPDPPPVLSPDPTLGAALLRTWPSRLLSRQPTSNCVCMPVLGMAPKVFRADTRIRGGAYGSRFNAEYSSTRPVLAWALCGRSGWWSAGRAFPVLPVLPPMGFAVPQALDTQLLPVPWRVALDEPNAAEDNAKHGACTQIESLPCWH